MTQNLWKCPTYGNHDKYDFPFEGHVDGQNGHKIQREQDLKIKKKKSQEDPSIVQHSPRASTLTPPGWGGGEQTKGAVEASPLLLACGEKVTLTVFMFQKAQPPSLAL